MQSSLSRSPKPQYFPSTMLPPPPLPPMARPVAIIRSTGEVSMSGPNSPPPNITPPCSDASPPEEVNFIMRSKLVRANDNKSYSFFFLTLFKVWFTLQVPELSSSPPLSPGSHERRKSPSQRNSVPTSNPYSPTRDYSSFSHFHGQQGHVGS